MRRAKIIDSAMLEKDRVGIGMKARVKDLSTGEEIEFSIVGATESDPAENKITNESLWAKALSGKKSAKLPRSRYPTD